MSRVRFVFAQRGASSLGFQLGSLGVSFLYPRHWFLPYQHRFSGWRFPQIVQIRWWPLDK